MSHSTTSSLPSHLSLTEALTESALMLARSLLGSPELVPLYIVHLASLACLPWSSLLSSLSQSGLHRVSSTSHPSVCSGSAWSPFSWSRAPP